MSNPKRKRSTTELAIQALVQAGAGRFHDPQSIGLGRILGAALGPYLQREQILELAGEALEDGNWHDDAALVRALLRPIGNRLQRRRSRRGRFVQVRD